MNQAVEPASAAGIGGELRRLLAAIQYFTRLPVPRWVGHSQALLDDATRYFPAVGLLVGAAAALVLWGAAQVWSPPIAAVLSIVTTLVLTGAMHEDGLADATDGLAGSRDRSRSLDIMKDPRIGAFGAAALCLALLLKFALLCALPTATVVWALIAGHVVSRLGAVLIMATLGYIRDAADSRSKPLVQRISVTSVVVGCVTGAIAVVPMQLRGLVGALLVMGVCSAWRGYLKRRLGGYTGDCLGAAQQLGELSFYLVCAARV